MKTEYKGFIIKVSQWGDSITPMYKFKLYRKRKRWFPKLVWSQSLHRKEMTDKVHHRFDYIIDCYQEELERWS
jgi:hypothetical protein